MAADMVEEFLRGSYVDMVNEALKGAWGDVKSRVTMKEKVSRAAFLGKLFAREFFGLLTGLTYVMFVKSVWREPEKYKHRWNFRLHRNLRYGNAKRTMLDVYTPENSDLSSSLPVLMFVHGGVWSSGDKTLFSPIGATLAHHGLIAVLVQYSLYPKVLSKDQVQELSQALTWTQDNIHQFGGDPERVHVMGHSSGAHLCGMLFWERVSRKLNASARPGVQAVDKRQPRCYIGCSGVYNIAEHYKYEIGRGVHSLSCMNPANGGPENFDAMSPELLFESLLPLIGKKKDRNSKNGELTQDKNGLEEFDWDQFAASVPPFINFASDNDITVPPTSSIKFSHLLRKLGFRSGTCVHETLAHDDFVCWVRGYKGVDNLPSHILLKDILEIVRKDDHIDSFVKAELTVTD
ncbi:hypothetical protein R1sor_023287 [Riccia sorocarpa]|uniref:protein-S-isoprenylcysteine alpha-carbonyl methylesterase n=1 Tax=Riccia sorocarpa TaxID=122646 RepID=A0ABD3GNR5_9MARC